jgi:SAM-dependent methyltransferase
MKTTRPMPSAPDPTSRTTWHYGLIAQWWDEFARGGPDIPYVRNFIENHGQPALDAGCGTGRVLLPLLASGFDVDGSDVSEDMLALCAARAQRDGLAPRLYHEALHELAIPRLYRSIFLCGVFGIGGDRERDWEGLRRLYRQLAPGGALLIEHQDLSRSRHLWKYALPEERAGLPEPPLVPDGGEPLPLPDGSALRLRARVLAYDAEGPSITHEMLAERFVGGSLQRSELGTLREGIYARNEIVLMLERVGFSSVHFESDHSASEATPEAMVSSIIAKK